MKSKLMNRSLIFYGLVVSSILFVILLISMVVSTSDVQNVDDINEPDNEIPTNPEDNDTDEVPSDDPDEDVSVDEELIGMPVDVEYDVYRHFWHEGLTDEEKNMAQINSTTLKGTTLKSSEGTEFSAVAPFSGEIVEIGVDIRGNFVIIQHNDIRVEIHSLKIVQVSTGDQVAKGDQLGTATDNSYDVDAEVNIYIILRIAGQRSNIMDYLGEKVEDISKI